VSEPPESESKTANVINTDPSAHTAYGYCELRIARRGVQHEESYQRRLVGSEYDVKTED
jgi:hypothetical protein